MKTLYISDLDGTLLNGNAEISEFTEKTVNTLIQNGAYFSVATARTAATALQMLSGISINVPIILMNGVSVYDTQKMRYIKTHTIERRSVERLFRILEEMHLTGFVYVIDDNVLSTYYERLYSEHARHFVEERVRKYGKRFQQIDSFSSLISHPVVYFSVCGSRESLAPVYDEFCKDQEVHIEFYRDIYDDGNWYLEVCSVKASKYNAVRFLYEEYQFDNVVSFGDNLNDLPLFLASDECYAVANAKPEVKEKASAVIGSNEEDGVANWLLTNCIQLTKHCGKNE